MRTKMFAITVLLISILCCTALASGDFDISVFLNNEKYEVEYDDMNDTFEINLTDGVNVLAIFDEDDGVLVGSIDIKGLEGQPPVLRIILFYSGEDWIFTDKVILKPNENRYTFEVDGDTDVDNGKIYEQYTLAITSKNIGLIEDVIAGNVFVKLRLDGDRQVNGSLMFLGDIESLYNDFVTAGGLKGDFSLFDIAFPCEIKVVQ